MGFVQSCAIPETNESIRESVYWRKKSIDTTPIGVGIINNGVIIIVLQAARHTHREKGKKRFDFIIIQDINMHADV